MINRGHTDSKETAESYSLIKDDLFMSQIEKSWGLQPVPFAHSLLFGNENHYDHCRGD